MGEKVTSVYLNAAEEVAPAVTENSPDGAAFADVVQALSKEQAIVHGIVATIVGKFYGWNLLGERDVITQGIRAMFTDTSHATRKSRIGKPFDGLSNAGASPVDSLSDFARQQELVEIIGPEGDPIAKP